MDGWPTLQGPLGSLPDDAIARLVDAGRVVELERDDVLVRQGERTNHVAVILDGRFRVVVATRSGKSVLLAIRGPGDVVGELSAVDGAPRSATVSAVEPARVRTVPASLVRELAEQHPPFMWALLTATVARLRAADLRFVGAAVEVTRTRVARSLLELAARHGRPVDGGVVLDVPLSQAELASWVGASREGVSGALSELRREELVTTERMAVTIRDLPGLRKVALGA